MARHEGWNTYADGYDKAARDDEREFKRLDAEIARMRAALQRIERTTKGYDDCSQMGCIHAIARDALKATQ